jgi:hypothetical protein
MWGTTKAINDACVCAAGTGDITVFQTLMATGYALPLANPAICMLAARSGHLDTLRWLRENGFAWDGVTTAACAQCSWFKESHAYPPMTPDELAVELEGNKKRMECLRWAVGHGCPFDSAVVAGTIAIDMETAEWLLPFLPLPYDGEQFYSALTIHDISTWRWGLTHGIIPPHKLTIMTDDNQTTAEAREKWQLVVDFWNVTYGKELASKM